MHNNVKQELSNWYKSNKEYIDTISVADVGSYDINGSTKDIIKDSVGFDIYDGVGVDVTIKPGVIPEEHINIYGAVTSISSFQCCPDSNIYKKQIIDLLTKDGILFLTMCATSCRGKHSTSPNEYNYGDGVRFTIDGLTKFFSDSFNVVECYEKSESDHNDLIYKGIKK